MLRALRSGTRILAASLKTAEQVADATLRGADDVTAPLEILLTLAEHPLSQAAIREFSSQQQGQ